MRRPIRWRGRRPRLTIKNGKRGGKGVMLPHIIIVRDTSDGVRVMWMPQTGAIWADRDGEFVHLGHAETKAQAVEMAKGVKSRG